LLSCYVVNPTSDVSTSVVIRARNLVEAEDFPTTDEEMLHARRKELKRQAYICGYRIKHFLSLRKHFIAEMDANQAELDELRPAEMDV
jgi:hypothetical protein